MKIRIISKERRFNSPLYFKYMSEDEYGLEYCSKIKDVEREDNGYIFNSDESIEFHEVEEIIDYSEPPRSSDITDDEDW